MVRITNGRQTVEVSRGAFENVYKGMGFHEVGVVAEELKTPKKPAGEQVPPPGDDTPGNDDTPEEEGDGDGLDVEALLEKPLSQWQPDELKEFVRIKGIDTTGATKVSQVRGIVKKYLEEQAKNGEE